MFSSHSLRVFSLAIKCKNSSQEKTTITKTAFTRHQKQRRCCTVTKQNGTFEITDMHIKKICNRATALYLSADKLLVLLNVISPFFYFFFFFFFFFLLLFLILTPFSSADQNQFLKTVSILMRWHITNHLIKIYTVCHLFCVLNDTLIEDGKFHFGNSEMKRLMFIVYNNQYTYK